MPPSGTSGGKPKGSGNRQPSGCPPISQALIEYLERTFPDRLPDELEGLRSIRFRSGQVAVVRHLRKQFERQTRDVLTPESMK